MNCNLATLSFFYLKEHKRSNSRCSPKTRNVRSFTIRLKVQNENLPNSSHAAAFPDLQIMNQIKQKHLTTSPNFSFDNDFKCFPIWLHCRLVDISKILATAVGAFFITFIICRRLWTEPQLSR